MGMVELAREAGARFIYPMFGVTLRDRQREYFYSRLDRIFPIWDFENGMKNSTVHLDHPDSKAVSYKAARQCLNEFKDQKEV